MKLDILAIGAHPDDIELAASGTLAKHKALGQKIGVVDLTEGELGTRGTIETRQAESREASKVLGLDARMNLKLKDGFFRIDNEEILEVIKAIRLYQPDIVLCNAVSDRHPDHGRAGALVREACFLSGLRKIETHASSQAQMPWRPRLVLHYIQSDLIMPDIIVDISGYWDIKLAAIKSYGTQFFNPGSQSNEPETFISTPHFMKSLEARAIEFGHAIGVEYGEGFTVDRKLGVSNLNHLI